MCLGHLSGLIHPRIQESIDTIADRCLTRKELYRYIFICIAHNQKHTTDINQPTAIIGVVASFFVEDSYILLIHAICTSFLVSIETDRIRVRPGRFSY